MNLQSFLHFIFLEKKNRVLLCLALGVTLVQFILFKFLYPYPDFLEESYSYIFAASNNLDFNIFPIGYSKFLLAFHNLTHSDTALVAFQYFFLECSCLYFFFTLLYFYNPGKAFRNILFIFLFFNPLFLYLSNYINSDSISTGLSLCWMAELIWIINRPRPYQIISQVVFLFLTFTLRENIIYYPFISAFAFILSRQKPWVKLAGPLFSFMLIAIFIIRSREAAYEMYDVKQFSPRSGWALANNALYMRGHIQVDSTEFTSAETRILDSVNRAFFRSIPSKQFNSFLSTHILSFFMADQRSPMVQYYSRHYSSKDEYEAIKNFGQASVLFTKYGEFFIKKYPIAYIRYFVLRNTKNYFLPPLENLEIYNSEQDNVPPSVQDWFDLRTPQVTSISKDIQASILYIYPSIFLFASILFIGSLVWLVIKTRRRQIRENWRNMMLLGGSYLLANFLFSIFTTAIVLRYQILPLILILILPLLILDYLDKKEKVVPGVDSHTISTNLKVSNA